MQKLGFTKNDARIYTTLLAIGLNSPATIADKSGVDRARVYDSLKRLVKKNVVEEEPVPRAPRYRAKPPDDVFNNIIEDYEESINLAKDINEDLQKIDLAAKVPNSAWAIRGAKKIKKLVKKFLKKSEKYFYIILTQDLTIPPKMLAKLSDIVMDKRLQGEEVKIKMGFKVLPENEDQKNIINQLYHNDVEIYHFHKTNILPLGLALNEKSFVQTYLSTVDPKPKYEFGIWMENCTVAQNRGFKHLCEYIFANLCKKVIFQKREN